MRRTTMTSTSARQPRINSRMDNQKKHYRRPRRRPAHLRTKTGCLTCRKRKKKCDETPVTCKNCSRGNHICAWPSEPSRGGSSRLRHVSSPTEVSNQGASPGKLALSPTIEVISHIEPSDNGNHGQTNMGMANPCIYTPSPFTPYSSIISRESIPLFEFLRTAFLPTLIHPMSHPTTIEFIKQEKLQSAFSTPFLMHALLACCGAEFPADDMHYRRIAEGHYAKAIGGLRKHLDSGTDSMVRPIVLLMAVIVLCIYERSKPRLSRGVDVHLLGAAQLIQLHLKRDKACVLSKSDTTMLHLMLEAFIFHATTSIPFQQPLMQSAVIDFTFPLAERALEESCRRSETCLYASSIIGVPPKLFGYIREIVLMHQRHSVDGVDILRCYELELILDYWNGNQTSFSHRPLATPVCPPRLPSYHEASPGTLSLGPKLYILASRILLRCLINFSSSPTSMEIHTDTHISSLVSDGVFLITQLQPSTDYYAEYYCWPILVVGISTVDQLGRECLLSQVIAFWKVTKNGTMRRLVDILTRYWGDEYKGVDISGMQNCLN